MKTLRNVLFLVCIVAIDQSFAAPYSLPTDGGWYQLQSTTTFQTVCQTGDKQPCDVAPGDYQLVNHNLNDISGQPVKTPVTVVESGSTGSGTNSIVHLVEQCTEAIGSNCNLTCPAEFIPSGISCSATRDGGSEFVVRDIIGRFDSSRGFCESASGILDFGATIRLACVRQ